MPGTHHAESWRAQWARLFDEHVPNGRGQRPVGATESAAARWRREQREECARDPEAARAKRTLDAIHAKAYRERQKAKRAEGGAIRVKPLVLDNGVDPMGELTG